MESTLSYITSSFHHHSLDFRFFGIFWKQTNQNDFLCMSSLHNFRLMGSAHFPNCPEKEKNQFAIKWAQRVLHKGKTKQRKDQINENFYLLFAVFSTKKNSRSRMNTTMRKNNLEVLSRKQNWENGTWSEQLNGEKSTFDFVAPFFFWGSRLGFNSFLACLHFGHNAAIRRCCYILCVSPKMCCIADNLFHLNTDTCSRFHTQKDTHINHSLLIIFSLSFSFARSLSLSLSIFLEP